MNFSGILIPLLAVFIQTTSNGITENIIIGEMLLIENNEIFFNITEPIHQQMHLSSGLMIIYYPEEARAFNIEYEHNDLRTLAVPQIELPDSNHFEQIGFKKANQRVNGDTLITQYISAINPKNPTLITQKIVNGKTSQIIFATSLGNINYFQLDFQEYASFKGKDYIKNYSTTTVANGKLSEKVNYFIQEVKIPDEIDIKRLQFIVPDSIDIELRNFN